MILAFAVLLLQSATIDSTLLHTPGGRPDLVTAVRVPAAARLTIDGRLDEPAWASATPITQLIQRDPDEGAPPSETTDVRILYDGTALYVGARLFDSAP